MERIKYSCNFSILKSKERCLFRNTHQFQGLDIVGICVAHGVNNFQSCILAGIKNLHQEINTHTTLSASTNHVISYWLLPRSRRERADTFSMKLHLLPSGLCLLLLMTDAKNLEVCTFKDDVTACTRGLLSDWQTSFIFFVTNFFLCLHRELSLVQFCHTIYFCMESVLPLCPNQALLLENAMLYASGKNFEG